MPPVAVRFYPPPQQNLGDAAAELERLWEEDLALDGEAHTLAIGQDRGWLDFVTWLEEERLYATGRIALELPAAQGG